MVATARKSGTDMHLNVSRAAMADILEVVAHHNPSIPKEVLTGKSRVVAAVAAAAVRLSDEQQRHILTHEKTLGKAMETVVADLAADRSGELLKIETDKPVRSEKVKAWAPLSMCRKVGGGWRLSWSQTALRIGPVRLLVRVRLSASSEHDDQPCMSGKSGGQLSDSSGANGSMFSRWLSSLMVDRPRACPKS